MICKAHLFQNIQKTVFNSTKIQWMEKQCVHACVRASVCVCMRACVCVCVCVCMRVCVHFTCMKGRSWYYELCKYVHCFFGTWCWFCCHPCRIDTSSFWMMVEGVQLQRLTHPAGLPGPSWQRLVCVGMPGVASWEVTQVLSQVPQGTASSCCTSPGSSLVPSLSTAHRSCMQTDQSCYRILSGANGLLFFFAAVYTGDLQQK